MAEPERIPLSPERAAWLRQMTGKHPWELVTDSDIRVMLAVADILNAEAAKILGEPWPP